MSLVLRCPRPECGQQFSLAVEQVRPHVRCPHCQHIFPSSEGVRQDGALPLPPTDGAAPKDPRETGALTPGPEAAEDAQESTPLVSVPGYEILGELGRGAMGVVYRARQVAANRVVALKMILVGEHADPEIRRRFTAEAEAVARLEHPNTTALRSNVSLEGTMSYAIWLHLAICHNSCVDKNLRVSVAL